MKKYFRIIEVDAVHSNKEMKNFKINIGDKKQNFKRREFMK